MAPETIARLAGDWVRRGWLRPLDGAFLRFLRELDPAADGLVLLAALLASHQLGRGHICLDLAATLDAPDETLSLPPEGEWDQSFADLPSRVLAGVGREDWCDRLRASSLVAEDKGDTQAVETANPLQSQTVAESRPFPAGEGDAVEIGNPLPPGEARVRAEAPDVSMSSPQAQGSPALTPTGFAPLASLSPQGEGLNATTLTGFAPLASPSPRGDVPEEGDTPLVLAAGRLYLRRYWRCERQVAAAIGSRLRRSPPPPDNLAELLETLFAGSADIPEWPRIACALAARGSFTVVTGGPGTGKTTTVVKLVALLQAGAGRERPLRVRLAAPTGKAAARLTESIGKAIDQVPETLRAGIPREAVTLHKLLGARPGTRRLRYGAGHPLHADLVVVDEASMIDLEMMAALLAALRPETRLVLLGDKDQLASVEAGAVLADLCAGAEVAGYDGATAAWLEAVAGQHPEVAEEPRGGLRQQLATLRISRRYGEDSGIGRLARAVNAGDAAAAAEIWRGPYPDLLRIDLEAMADDGFAEFLVEGWAPRQPGGQEGGAGYRAYLHTLESGRPQAGAAAARFDEWAGEVLDAFDGFRVLCATRRGDCGVDGLNQRIAETLLRRRLISQAHGWYEGRPVMLAHNDYGLGLMNGDIGIALQVPVAGGEYRLRACFRLPDGRIKQVLPSRLGDCETVYAMTVHKSQGSEFGHVALVLPDSRNPILTRELVYTGITRAKRRFSLVARDFAVLDWALERRVRRSGGLAELLKNV